MPLRALDELITLLDLEEIEVNVFRGRSPDEPRQRVYGGQVAGQALVAAARTVERGVIHSLHAYFLRPGDVGKPILYQVDRIRDGKTFTTRRVLAVQHGKSIFALSASFQPPEDGPDHQMPMPDAPDPESLPTWTERAQSVIHKVQNPELREWLQRERPIDTRNVDSRPLGEKHARPPRQMVWIRAKGQLPDALTLHQCIVTYASDMTLLDTATLPHAIAWNDPGYLMASLDHAMWFHRPFRADEWLLYAQDSPSASGARGFAMGHFFTRAGKLVASVAQEGLMRPLRSDG